MNNENPPRPEQLDDPLENAEIENLSARLRSSEVIGDNFEIVPVGEAGYIIRLGEMPPVPGNDWVLFDLDDTLIAYSKAKEARLKAYLGHAQETGLELAPATAEQLIDITDRFARWDEGNAEVYHLDAHKKALAWATSVLREVPANEVAEKIHDIETQLESIKRGAGENEAAADSEPFHFVGNRLVTNEADVSQENLDDVFDVMVNVPSYEDALAAMRDLGGDMEDEHRVNTGIFTYGEPEFQLRKALELLNSQARLGEELPVSQIWLTRISKGEFLEEVNTAFGTYEGPSQAGSLQEELFSEMLHVLMLVDDDPKQLNEFWASKSLFSDSQTHPASVRTIRENTKTEKRKWVEPGDSMLRGVFDATSEGPEGKLADDIYSYLLTNFSRLVERKGDTVTDPDVKARVNARAAHYLEKSKKSRKPKYIVTFRE